MRHQVVWIAAIHDKNDINRGTKRNDMVRYKVNHDAFNCNFGSEGADELQFIGMIHRSTPRIMQEDEKGSDDVS